MNNTPGIRPDNIREKNHQFSHDVIEKIERMHSQYAGLGYYGVLGLPEHATASEIKSAYYKRAKEYHPDLHIGLPDDMKKKLLEIFAFITNAYIKLRDTAQRNEGDRWFEHYPQKK